MRNLLIVGGAFVGSANAAYSAANTKTCKEFVDVKAAGTNTLFVHNVASAGLTANQLVWYEAGTGGYTGGGLFDKTLYKVKNITAGPPGKFELFGIKADGSEATNGVRITAFTDADAFKLSNGKFTKVEAMEVRAKANAGNDAMQTDNAGGGATAGANLKSYVKFTVANANFCAVAFLDKIQVHWQYAGVSADGSAAGTASTLVKGTTGLETGTTYKCIAITGTTFGLMPSGSSLLTKNHALNKDATAADSLIPNIANANGATPPAPTGAGNFVLVRLANKDNAVNSKDICVNTTTTAAATTTKKASSTAARALGAMFAVALMSFVV